MDEFAREDITLARAGLRQNNEHQLVWRRNLQRDQKTLACAGRSKNKGFILLRIILHRVILAVHFLMGFYGRRIV